VIISKGGIKIMPDKTLADLEEMADPEYDGCPGSDYEEYRYELEEIALHQENMQKAWDEDTTL
jgi:hypothetical protein